MKYCSECGRKVIDKKCSYCGKNYDSDKERIEQVKGHFKKRIRKHVKIKKINLILLILFISFLIVLYFFFYYKGNFGQRTPFQTYVPGIKEGEIEIKIPSLQLFHQMTSKFNVDGGCFGRVDSIITNDGNTNAIDVSVKCKIDSFSSEKYIGIIKQGETASFQIILNYDCNSLKEEQCIVTCKNC